MKNKKEIIPVLNFPQENKFVKEARKYVEKTYANNYGSSDPITKEENTFFPTTFDEAEAWLDDFLNHRSDRFGIFEDAMVANV